MVYARRCCDGGGILHPFLKAVIGPVVVVLLPSLQGPFLMLPGRISL